MRRKISIILTIAAFITFTYPAFGTGNEEGVKWLTFEEAERLAKDDPRPLFIDLYTDWCGWCKRLDSETLSHPVIASILNEKFYPVKMNAETKDEITFLGQKFINDGRNGKTHQLAIAIGTVNERIGFPTVAFFNDKLQLLSAVPGFRVAAEMEPLLQFFGTEAHQKQPYEEFIKDFNGKIKQGSY